MSAKQGKAKERQRLTLEYLRERVHYDPDTGIFTWRRPPPYQHRCKPGEVAGTRVGEGYIDIWLDRVVYKAHRLAWFYMTGEWPPDQIDHINRVRDDNRFANLRLATVRENALNRGPEKLKGTWIERRQGWKAAIRINGKTKYLGLFPTSEDAVAAYHAAARSLKLRCSSSSTQTLET